MQHIKQNAYDHQLRTQPPRLEEELIALAWDRWGKRTEGGRVDQIGTGGEGLHPELPIFVYAITGYGFGYKYESK